MSLSSSSETPTTSDLTFVAVVVVGLVFLTQLIPGLSAAEQVLIGLVQIGAGVYIIYEIVRWVRRRRRREEGGLSGA